MKKKIFVSITILIVLIGIVTGLNSTDRIMDKQNKILTAYFSCDSSNTIDQLVTSATPKVNNTKKLAEMIQKEVGGDLFPIITTEKYEDNYSSVVEIAKIEKSNNSRPQLVNEVENMEFYDTIILAYPNWWHTMPMPVFTFLESYDFSGKVIYPVCTHGGGGIGNSVEDIRKSFPETEVKDGLSISGYKIENSLSQIKKYFELN